LTHQSSRAVFLCTVYGIPMYARLTNTHFSDWYVFWFGWSWDINNNNYLGRYRTSQLHVHLHFYLNTCGCRKNRMCMYNNLDNYFPLFISRQSLKKHSPLIRLNKFNRELLFALLLLVSAAFSHPLWRHGWQRFHHWYRPYVISYQPAFCIMWYSSGLMHSKLKHNMLLMLHLKIINFWNVYSADRLNQHRG